MMGLHRDTVDFTSVEMRTIMNWWETRFMAYLELKELKSVVTSTDDTVDATRNSKAFSELVQYLDEV